MGTEFARAPFRARINLSHFGADINYLIYLVKLFSNFGAGQKNNLCHGPVAQVRMAPMSISNALLNLAYLNYAMLY